MATVGESSCSQIPKAASEDSWLAIHQADRNQRMRREHGNVEYKEKLLTLVSMNLTSWRKNSMRAFEQEADIVAIQETRISEVAKDAATRHAAAQGFHAVWGKGMKLTTYKRKRDGVAVEYFYCNH